MKIYLILGLFLLSFNVSCVKSHNENYLEIAKETTKSNVELKTKTNLTFYKYLKCD